MSTSSQRIDLDLAHSISVKSNQELIGILEHPAEWRQEVVDFARSELGRRSISSAQIDQTLVKKAGQRAEELQERATVPLTFWESTFTILYGAALGLLGLIFVWPQASGFKCSGYTLKHHKSWRIYWLAFGIRFAAVVVIVIIAFVTSH